MKHNIFRRALPLLLVLALCLGMVPTAFAAQDPAYHDPAEHWQTANNRTNELDANSLVTVNAKVGEIAVQVGTTPAAWNAGVFSLIWQLSETVILPIAGLILTLEGRGYISMRPRSGTSPVPPEQSVQGSGRGSPARRR